MSNLIAPIFFSIFSIFLLDLSASFDTLIPLFSKLCFPVSTQNFLPISYFVFSFSAGVNENSVLELFLLLFGLSPGRGDFLLLFLC